MILFQILFSVWSSASCVTSLEPSYFSSQLLLNTTQETLYTVEMARKLLENDLVERDHNDLLDYPLHLALVGDILALQIGLANAFDPQWNPEFSKLIMDQNPEEGFFPIKRFPQWYNQEGTFTDLSIYKRCILEFNKCLKSPNPEALLLVSEWKKILQIYQNLKSEGSKNGIHLYEFNAVALLHLTANSLQEILKLSDDYEIQSGVVDFLYDRKIGIMKSVDKIDRKKTNIRKVLIESLLVREEDIDTKLIDKVLLKTIDLIENYILPLMELHDPSISNLDTPHPLFQNTAVSTQNPSVPLDK